MRPIVGTLTEKLSYFADRCVSTVQTVAGGDCLLPQCNSSKHRIRKPVGFM